jgi:hypothetical protein
MKKAFLPKVIYRQMVANIFSEEYIFFSDFLNHIFFLGIVNVEKHRANLSDVAKERVKQKQNKTQPVSVCFAKPINYFFWFVLVFWIHNDTTKTKRKAGGFGSLL